LLCVVAFRLEIEFLKKQKLFNFVLDSIAN